MKKFVVPFCALLLSAIISCNDGSKTNTTTTETSMAQNNSDRMKATLKGIETGNMSAIDDFLADDVVDHATPNGDIKGRDAIKKMLSEMHNHVSNLKIELVSDATSASGDYYYALGRMTGTTTDSAMGMPANTALDQTSVDVIKMVNGKATEHWSFEDPKMMMKMMSMQKPMDAMNKMDDKMMDKRDTMQKK
ncbi:MAG: ester cyclase [Ferruginibacter sp.]